MDVLIHNVHTIKTKRRTLFENSSDQFDILEITIISDQETLVVKAFLLPETVTEA